MKLVVLGNGPFAAPTLAKLAESRHSIALVVARPDRPQGKHQQVLPGPVAALATQLGLPLAQPPSANEPNFVARLAGLGPDLLVVADYGEILRPACLAAARLGGINLHGSLLPKYRGAAPIVWAIYHGETESGVTVIQMTPELDGGGMLAQCAVPIGPDQTAEVLESELSRLAARMALEAVDALEQGTARPIPQDSQRATRAPRVKKEDGNIDWSRAASQIHNQIRAMRPWPIAFTYWHRPNAPATRLQILRSTFSNDAATAAPGTIVGLSPAFRVATGSGILEIQCLRPAGKAEMDAATFLRGYRPQVGQRLERE